MRDTAPRIQGIIAVACVFGLIAAGVAMVMYEYQLAGAALIGLIVAAITAIALMLGWRDPKPSPMNSDVKAPADVRRVAPTAAPAPAPAAATRPAPVANGAAVSADPMPAAAMAPMTPAPTDADKPATLSAPRAGGADDLKLIKGVGPKLEAMLHGMGFYHFDQIASWQAREVAWVDENLEGFKGRVTRDDWVAQAKVLAAGGTTAFSDKVKKGDVY